MHCTHTAVSDPCKKLLTFTFTTLDSAGTSDVFLKTVQDNNVLDINYIQQQCQSLDLKLHGKCKNLHVQQGSNSKKNKFFIYHA